MAIDLFSGTPGSGKSLHAAKKICEWSKAGKPVITNFEVDLSQYPKANQTCVDDDDLTPDYLVQFSRTYFEGRKLTKKDEDTILLVIDECQLIFNSREYQKKDRKSWIKLFSTHRHLGYHVILIAQMDKMLDKQIRGLIEYEFIHRKLSNFGKAGKLLTVALAGEMFTSVQMWYPLKLKIGTQMFRAKKKYYSIYDSYAAFGEPKALPSSAEPAQEETAAPELDPAPSAPMIADKYAAASSDPDVKVGEIVDLKKEKKISWQQLISRIPRIRKKEKKHRRPRYIPGTYQTLWSDNRLCSFKGKYLRPGGRSETGWLRDPAGS